MATYLLLRNNKHSGPYTLEALVQLGLKPYDLVWLEGKSAAWRYPSEIDDLKFFAPVVEEQPYDRFYKKPSDALKEDVKKVPVTEEIARSSQTTQNHLEEVKQNAKISEIKVVRKQIYVSLPGKTGNTIIKRPESVTAAAKSQENSEYQMSGSAAVQKTESSVPPSYSALVSDYNSYQPAAKKILPKEDTSPVSINEAAVETKYTQSLDDIKDMYVQTLADRKRKTAKRKMFLTVVKRATPFAAVLLLGFVLGGFLMRQKSGKLSASLNGKPQMDQLVLQKQETVNPEPQQVIPPASVAADTVAGKKVISDPALGTIDPSSSSSISVQKDLAKDKAGSNQPLQNPGKKIVTRENGDTKPADSKSLVTSAKPQNAETDPSTGERNKVVRTGGENGQEAGSTAGSAANAKTGLMKQVNVTGNQYKVGTFGGIHDLQLTVVNNSNFLLDHVMVELQYLKPSEQPLKTNNVQFNNVPPNGSLTLAIPPTNRGIKVTYKVINVQSKAAGNDTAGL